MALLAASSPWGVRPFLCGDQSVAGGMGPSTRRVGRTLPQSAAMPGLDRAARHLARHCSGLGGGCKAFKPSQRLRIAGQENLGAPRRTRCNHRRDPALGGLAIAAIFLPDPQGFLFGTISIGLSAVAFLVFISWLWSRTPLSESASAQQRAEDDTRERKQIERFTKWLFGIACLVALAVWISPTQVGRFLGSMVVVYFAFGAILALINAFEFAVVWTTKRQWFGETAKPRVVGAYAVAFVIGLAVLNAWLHPFHRVRLCDSGDCVSAIPEQRPTVAAAARAWYEQAKASYAKAHDGEPVPMFIVATAGGIRAAYWTATILEKLDKDFAAEGGVRPYLFAISGVSGGSVGAAAFEAALTKRDEGNCKGGDKACPLATSS